MNKRMVILALAVMMLTLSAGGWGPKTQLCITTNALYLLSQDADIPLERLEKEVRSGAMISMDDLNKRYPSLLSQPMDALESEMNLLLRVRSSRVDPYFAHRLGVLGKMTALATAPLRQASPSYRNLYYADVERRIEGISIKTGTRQLVEPRVYFPRVLADAGAGSDVIAREYQAGKGFEGMAALNLANDTSRSVRAVADVWYTVLTGAAKPGNISDRQLQEYVLDAYRFYIDRKNAEEIDAAEQRLTRVTPVTTDMRVRIGDMYYAAELFERAMQEYQAVHIAAPERRDVVEKIAEYSVRVGADALKDKRLEAARDAFKTAVDANPLHPTAERDRIEAEALIAARDTRLALNQDALKQAHECQTKAEQEALASRYAEAIAQLHQAEAAYEQVTDEFPAEYQQRTRGLNDVHYKIGELKKGLMANAQTLSGIGFASDLRDMARSATPELDKQTLRAILNNTYQSQLGMLQDRLKPVLAAL